jgi:hypothetical protein
MVTYHAPVVLVHPANEEVRTHELQIVLFSESGSIPRSPLLLLSSALRCVEGDVHTSGRLLVEEKDCVP